jgi:acyl dehydratase
MVLLARQLYFEAVKVGDELPPLVKPPVDRSQIARYAGASGDYGPLHVDEPFARNAGFPGVLVPGMLAMGFLGELATDWLRGARLRRFSARFVKIVWPGDVVTVRGRVADRRFEPGGQYAVDIEVWGENQRGELVVRGAVTAQLFYSAEDESRQRGGQPPLVVTQADEEERLARLSRSSAPARPAVGTRPATPGRPTAAAARIASPARPAPPPTPVAARAKPAASPVRPPAAPRKSAPAKAPARKPAPGKAAAKKPTAKKPTARKAAGRKAPAGKARPARPAARKPAGKPAARKAAARSAPARKKPAKRR